MSNLKALGRRSQFTLAGVLGVILTFSLLFALAGSDSVALAQEDPLRAAWEKARAARTYRFSAEINGVVKPLSALDGAEEAFLLALQGEVDGPEKTRLRLWADGASLAHPDEAVELLTVDGKTYTRRDGQWEKTEASVGTMGSDGRFLTYLEAARDVEPLEPVERGGMTYQRYRFTLDGERYAQILFRELRDVIQEELPPGVEAQPAAELSAIEGAGEVWLDPEGYPIRLLLQVTMPKINRNFASQAEMKVDLFSFGEPIEPPILPPEGEDGAGKPHPLSSLPALGYVLPFLFLSFDNDQRRRRYTYPFTAVRPPATPAPQN